MKTLIRVSGTNYTVMIFHNNVHHIVPTITRYTDLLYLYYSSLILLHYSSRSCSYHQASFNTHHPDVDTNRLSKSTCSLLHQHITNGPNKTTYITLHYITLHYITLHYITLHYNTIQRIEDYTISTNWLLLHKTILSFEFSTSIRTTLIN